MILEGIENSWTVMSTTPQIFWMAMFISAPAYCIIMERKLSISIIDFFEQIFHPKVLNLNCSQMAASHQCEEMHSIDFLEPKYSVIELEKSH